MTEYECCLCGNILNDENIEVRHYGLKSACKPCVDKLYEIEDNTTIEE